MIVTPIKTDLVTPKSCTIFELLDNHLPKLSEKSIVVITSKVVSLCEGSVAPLNVDRTELIKQQASHYIEPSESAYNKFFTITNNTLVANAGIDSSNAANTQVLWPKDAIKTANEAREYLSKKHGLQHVGIIITDSTSRPFRLGATGIELGFSGFIPYKNYRDTADLFNRPFVYDSADIAGGLAAGAVVAMGEGAEQTPLAIITDVPFVEFVQRPPNKTELKTLNVTLKEDFYEVFFKHAPWKQS